MRRATDLQGAEQAERAASETASLRRRLSTHRKACAAVVLGLAPLAPGCGGTLRAEDVAGTYLLRAEDSCASCLRPGFILPPRVELLMDEQKGFRPVRYTLLPMGSPPYDSTATWHCTASSVWLQWADDSGMHGIEIRLKQQDSGTLRGVARRFSDMALPEPPECSVELIRG